MTDRIDDFTWVDELLAQPRHSVVVPVSREAMAALIARLRAAETERSDIDHLVVTLKADLDAAETRAIDNYELYRNATIERDAAETRADEAVRFIEVALSILASPSPLDAIRQLLRAVDREDETDVLRSRVLVALIPALHAARVDEEQTP
jgi:replication fork clamp-binding protein CrfC